ncbi:MAG: DUF4145 domain-containing protein [Candidatus Glassbacteria bacterium]|nr:DUF4145 domain-containing protein [Candidatus Glassbacteria bacterium]
MAVVPNYKKRSFECPVCNAHAQQFWYRVIKWFKDDSASPDADNPADYLYISKCNACNNQAVWVNKKMILPDIEISDTPNPDLKKDIQDDFNEAKSITPKSPRAAAALLRLCIQKLCKQLGKPGKNINEDIASLVKDGMPVGIQKALDIVRVTGNEAVHPGVLDLKDDIDTVQKMFRLVNFIAHDRITQPKEVDALYQSLPEEKRKAIEKRDGS